MHAFAYTGMLSHTQKYAQPTSSGMQACRHAGIQANKVLWHRLHSYCYGIHSATLRYTAYLHTTLLISSYTFGGRKD